MRQRFVTVDFNIKFFTAKVAGDSMRPALRPGDWLLVRRGAPIRPGDVVVARRPDRRDLLVIKRAVRREADGWWIEGDNPHASHDSWTFGAVPEELLVGRVIGRYWPWPPLPISSRRRSR